MIYIRLPLVLIWMILSCAYGLGLCLVRWGDPSVDRGFARFFSWGVLRICGIRVTVEGAEHLEARQPAIYVANHQSGMDMATFGAMYPSRTVVVGKKELLYIPFFGLYFKAAGSIVLNRQKTVSAIAGLKQAADQVRARQVSVWIFPEGTRNRTDDVMMPFKKGAFYMALQARVPIVPIVCSPLSGMIDWKKKLMRGGKVTVRVLPPVETDGYGERDVERLSNLVRERMHEALLSLSDASSVNYGR
jgi:1-acyl-sn-glycerol-3-phosphate acyltransferase